MSQSDNGGCGCLAMIGVLFLLLCAYPVFDGYVNRGLPAKEKAAIQVEAAVNQLESKWYLSVSVKNPTEWIIGHATVALTVTLRDGTRRDFIGKIESGGSTNLDISSKESGVRYCAFPLPEDAATLFARNEVEKWDWRITGLDGRRNPIRLVKRPVDWLRGLFEREN